MKRHQCPFQQPPVGSSRSVTRSLAPTSSNQQSCEHCAPATTLLLLERSTRQERALSVVRRGRSRTNRVVGERPPCAVAARAEDPLADRRPCMSSKRPELSHLWAIRRSFVSIRRVVQVRLDRRLCASQPVRDLGDRQTLLFTVMAREHGGPASLLDTVCARHRPATITLAVDRYRTCLTFPPGGQGT